MKLWIGLLVGAAIVSASSGRLLLKDGMEYNYKVQTTSVAGTMDYQTAGSGWATRYNLAIQVSGKTLNIKASNIEESQFVGNERSDVAYNSDLTKFTPVPGPGEEMFSVTTGSDGLFESMTVMSGKPIHAKNLMRAMASTLQVATGPIKEGKKSFKSREKVVHGNCEFTYTVKDGMIIKTTTHNEDCEDRQYRIIDDFRGFRCDGDGKKGMNYPSSINTVVMAGEKTGGEWKINKIVSTGAMVAQFFNEEGASQFTWTNMTADLESSRSSPGDISVSGETLTDIYYERADSEYAWDKKRDLKAREPMFSFGHMVEEDSTATKQAIRKGIAYQKTIVETLDKDKEALEKAHKYGINNILPAFYALDYDGLKSLADELFADKSDNGVFMSNMMGELLGSTGTTASALVIRDLILEEKFDNDRDAARILSSIPFHIRRPNKQLLEAMRPLKELPGNSLVNMAVRLSAGNLIRVTCLRAGTPGSAEVKRCFEEWAAPIVQETFEKYKASDDREEKSALLSVISNIRFGGGSSILAPLINGEIDKDDEALRSAALWAVGWESVVTQRGVEVSLPIFADSSNGHELRISALELVMYSMPKASTMNVIIAVLRMEKDYEVLNYGMALLERWAASIDPCQRHTSKLVQFYLKYLKQATGFETNWGFGVSKTYSRNFIKKKYGYGGGFTAWSIGSKKSTTPLTFGIAVTNNMMEGAYQNVMFSFHIRIEGLAKAVIRKFKNADPSSWKTADLEKVLTGDMNIRERPNQPVRVQILINLKNDIVFQRQYDEDSMGKDGKIGKLLENLQGLGDTYTLNHQRAFQVGSLLYEQPTTLGLPMGIITSITHMTSLEATIKRGNVRGLLYRDLKYEGNMFTQAIRGAFIHHPWKKASFGILNSRLYHLHVPRKLVVGVNPIKKELKLSIARPSADHPWRLFMHSQTSVLVRGNNLMGKYENLQQNCPSCKTKVIVSRGENAIKNRVFIDRENERRGAKIFGEYFDCEMDIGKKNTVGTLLGAFMPYNKQPKTLWTSIMMGIRQVRTFLFYFPKTEQCGAQLKWSQSTNNPVNEIEISLRVNAEKNGERLFFRGRKMLIKALVKAKGEPEERSYRINIAYETTPGNLENSLKVQINRSPLEALGITPYSVCFAFENKYPDFSKEFMDYDRDNQMSVSGKAMVQYGAASSCGDAEGEIRVNFEHSTTAEARQQLADKWYSKSCMALKETEGWKDRGMLPISEACYMMVKDATSARKYTWDIQFVKLTERLKNILSKVRTAVKAGLLPYWDVDPDEVEALGGEIGPFLNIEAVLKDDESTADVTLKTKRGEEELKDYPLRLNWTKKLRNLKFTGTMEKLFKMGIINPCIVTKSDIRTNDNVTMNYTPSSCWTLTSATCGPNPGYAAFSKKSAGGPLPLAGLLMVGGHTVEFTPSGSNVGVTVNGNPLSLAEGEQHEHLVDGVEIFRIFRWGKTYSVYSFLRVWFNYDGHIVEVMPPPSAKGQHCGICGNYNRNKWDELEGKNEEQLASTDQLVKSWEWKC